jgi:hypothetical protein
MSEAASMVFARPGLFRANHLVPSQNPWVRDHCYPQSRRKAPVVVGSHTVDDDRLHGHQEQGVKEIRMTLSMMVRYDTCKACIGEKSASGCLGVPAFTFGSFSLMTNKKATDARKSVMVVLMRPIRSPGSSKNMTRL